MFSNAAVPSSYKIHHLRYKIYPFIYKIMARKQPPKNTPLEIKLRRYLVSIKYTSALTLGQITRPPITSTVVAVDLTEFTMLDTKFSICNTKDRTFAAELTFRLLYNQGYTMTFEGGHQAPSKVEQTRSCAKPRVMPAQTSSFHQNLT